MHIELQSVDKIFMFVNICYVTSLEKIDLIDIVFEVVDARIPYSSKNKEIEEIDK